MSNNPTLGQIGPVRLNMVIPHMTHLFNVRLNFFSSFGYKVKHFQEIEIFLTIIAFRTTFYNLL